MRENHVRKIEENDIEEKNKREKRRIKTEEKQQGWMDGRDERTDGVVK